MKAEHNNRITNFQKSHIILFDHCQDSIDRKELRCIKRRTEVVNYT